jgi:hypothetical protein
MTVYWNGGDCVFNPRLPASGGGVANKRVRTGRLAARAGKAAGRKAASPENKRSRSDNRFKPLPCVAVNAAEPTQTARLPKGSAGRRYRRNTAMRAAAVAALRD